MSPYTWVILKEIDQIWIQTLSGLHILRTTKGGGWRLTDWNPNCGFGRLKTDFSYCISCFLHHQPSILYIQFCRLLLIAHLLIKNLPRLFVDNPFSLTMPIFPLLLPCTTTFTRQLVQTLNIHKAYFYISYSGEPPKLFYSLLHSLFN